jgi:hypothetical protein
LTTDRYVRGESIRLGARKGRGSDAEQQVVDRHHGGAEGDPQRRSERGIAPVGENEADALESVAPMEADRASQNIAQRFAVVISILRSSIQLGDNLGRLDLH